MLRQSIFILILLFATTSQTFGKKLAIEILGKTNTQQLSISISRGLYDVHIDHQVVNLKKGDVITINGYQLTLSDTVAQFKFSTVRLEGKDYVNHFKINILQKTHQYDDDIVITWKNNALKIINHVDLDHYVAGVVEGEAGYNLPLEYYKLQAILCRTYALNNINRHEDEGFNLCDEVHCQVYHKKCTKNEIVKATAATSGLVVVDNDLHLINTTFHSNCGGETCNSEDVWVSKVDYLRAVKDTFCIHQPHAYWRKEITKDDFKSVLSKNNQLDSSDLASALFLCQDTTRFPHKKLFSTKLTDLRRALKLRSTYFSVENDSNNLILHGRGFGHGVGLCQEGGIEMARRGYSYVDILKFYYQSVYIVNQRALLFFKEE